MKFNHIKEEMGEKKKQKDRTTINFVASLRNLFSHRLLCHCKVNAQNLFPGHAQLNTIKTLKRELIIKPDS